MVADGERWDGKVGWDRPEVLKMVYATWTDLESSLGQSISNTIVSRTPWNTIKIQILIQQVLGKGLQFCISNKLLSNADAVVNPMEQRCSDQAAC